MVNRLLQFIDASPVNFLAVKNITETLEKNGFRHMDATLPLGQIKPGDAFFVTKNDSSIYAFRMGKKPLAEGGFHIICSHCDSPCFRIKPNAEMIGENGILRLNTEVYGGAVLSTWFDRPLSLAGRVIIRTEDPLQPLTRLIHIKRPLLQISNLAIHFNRQVNDGVKLSKQKDMLPIMGYVTKQFSEANEKGSILLQLICEELNKELTSKDLKPAVPTDILDFDLYLYDTTPGCTFGLNQELISCGRLDDLSMVHASLEAMLAADKNPEITQVMAVFDNEETGSQTKQGAGSPYLASILQRLCGTMEEFYCAVEKAFMVSADNAHAWHPNYSEKYDPTNHPRLGGGPVIKFNAAQKYASDAVSAAVFASICEKAGVPCQRFVNHSDVAGGSTLGNILASSLPLRGVDMGNPVLAMHSVRETGSVADHEYCIKAFTEFYNL